jgi:hypothetical protein
VGGGAAAGVCRGGADLGLARRDTVWGVVWGVLVITVEMLSGEAFLKTKSYQPIIRHGDRAYNAAGV